MKKTAKRIYLCTLMLAVLIGAFVQAGCAGAAAEEAAPMEMMSSSSNGMSYMADTVYMEESAMEEPMAAPEMEEAGGSANANANQTQKLILNIYIDMEVENPSQAMEEIINYAQSTGGYLLYSDDYYNEEENRGGANVTIRVPSGSSQQMEEYLETIGTIESSSAQAEDVTGEYYDLQARIEQGELEVETLEELLSQCTTVEEVLLVRDQLSRAQSDLEGMKGRMRVLNELTGYDTIDISLRPIYSMVDTGNDNRLITGSEFLTGLSYGLQDSAYNAVNGLANFAIFLAENILQLALFAGIGFGIYAFIRAMIRKGKKRRAAKAAEASEINE